MSRAVLPPVRAAFRAIAETVVPEARDLDARGWADLEDIVERALAGRPASVRRQLRLLIRVLDLLPIAWTGRRLRALEAPARLAFLERMERHPVLLVRRGVWGLRTLVFMGYYARPAAHAAIGYRADPRGWDARR